MSYNGKDVHIYKTGTPVSDSNRLPVEASISGGTLVTEEFDYIAATYPTATSEVFTYKTGGAGGTTVATVTIVYTTAAKEFISTVTRS